MKSPMSPFLALALVACQTGGLRADDPPQAESKVESERAAAAVELARTEAGLYTFQMEDPARDPVAFQPQAILRWSSPAAGSIHGSVFVWTVRGCPVTVSSIYKWSSPDTHLGIELHALAPGIASVNRKGVRAWVPGSTVPVRKPMPDAPKPADSSAGRLRQLRALAHEFVGSGTLRNGNARNLRLLSQPIYRYRSENPEVIDGGLFAFVEATDPEIILVIEAVKGPNGPEWRFAAARMNSTALRLNHKGREVWSAPMMPWGQARNHNQPYTLFMFGSDPGMTFDAP